MTISFALSLVLACGDDDATGMGPGFTSCGDNVCQPGQYCGFAMFCSVGCTSDANCAANQRCDTANPDLSGVSQCVNRPAGMDAGPSTTPDAGPSTTPDAGGMTGPCDAVGMELQACGAIDNVEYAQLTTACNMGLLSPAEQQAFIACVNAGADCTEKEACLGEDDTCATDDECDNTRGDLTHEICDSGFCSLGCRDDLDCGDSSSCDDFTNQCFAD